MTMQTNLPALIARVRELDGPDREVDAAIAPLLGLRVVNEGHPLGRVCYDKDGQQVSLPRFTASIDAAMLLVPEGWQPSVGQNVHHYHWHAHIQTLCTEGEPVTMGQADAATPALALVLAALLAREEG